MTEAVHIDEAWTGMVRSYLGAVEQRWVARIEGARKAREPWLTVAEQCEKFFFENASFMWKRDFLDKYMLADAGRARTNGGAEFQQPTIGVTINKAFEHIAVIGPNVFWDYPTVSCAPPEESELEPALFQAFPNAEVAFQQYQASRAARAQHTRGICGLMSSYLNYSMREQPGGMRQHASLAVSQAMTTGRGVLWNEPYEFPESDRMLTGLFFDDVRNLYIDPACVDPTLTTAGWVVRGHMDTARNLERRFGLPRGALAGKGTAKSPEHAARVAAKQINGLADDLLTWYEVYSKVGIGVDDLTRTNPGGSVSEVFEQLAGDYVRLAIAPGVGYPLNMPPERFEDQAAGEQEVAEAVRWPFEAWRDNRWPCAILDFYQDPRGCYPVPPLGPALGPLICLHILTSALMDRTYENKNLFLGAVGSAKATIEESMAKPGSLKIIEINEATHGSISQLIEFLQAPSQNFDIINAIKYFEELFEKASGLSEINYGVASVASRTAADIQTRRAAAGVRPAKMASDVTAWLSDALETQRQLASVAVRGQDITELLGPHGAWFWDQQIASLTPEAIARQMNVVVSASDSGRPDKQAVRSRLQELGQILLPVLQQYASATGNTGPLNAYVAAYGDSIDVNTENWMLGPMAPPMPQGTEVAV